MLSRLCRAMSRASGSNLDTRSIQESLERNLNTISDDSNYTKDRILRVIRSYFFLANDSFKLRDGKKWGRDPVIQDSVHKLVPLVNQLEPDAVNLLIVNLGMLNVFNPSIWREIETQFLEISHRYLPTSNIVRVCESFSQARRKNEEVWSVLAEKFMSEIYSAGQLESADAARAYKSVLISRSNHPELLEKLRENVIQTIDSMSMKSLMIIIEGLAGQENRDPEFESLIFSRVIDYFGNISDPKYSLLLYQASKIRNHEVLAKLEELILSNLDNESIFQIAKTALNYTDEEFLSNTDRVQFLTKLRKYYYENKEKIQTNFSEVPEVFEKLDNKLLYVSYKLNIEVSDEDILKAYQYMENNERAVPTILKMKSDFEAHLKEKNLI